MPTLAAQILIAFSVGLLSQIGSASANDFPTRPVTVIVPYPAGGTSDVVIRALADAARPHLGQPLIIENRPGAGGALGIVQMASTAAADGYTVGLVTRPVLRFPLITKSPFDPLKNLTYIIGVSGYTFGIVVREDAPWQTLGALLDSAKQQPQKISYGTTGAGSGQHILMEELAKAQGITWIHIPFKGDADMLNALLGGHIDAILGAAAWAPLVETGKLKPLATLGDQRAKNWPDVRTAREQGYDYVLTAPFGLAGPAGIPRDAVSVLHNAFQKALGESSFQRVLDQFSMEVWYKSSQDYQDYAAVEFATLKKAAVQSGGEVVDPR